MNRQRSFAPIFIVGVPRSGTTLLAAMLGAHPRLVCGPETHFFDHMSFVDSRAICRPSGWPNNAVDYLYSIKHVGESIPANFGLTRQALLDALARKAPSIPSILSGMVDIYMERNGKQRWVEKTPDHLPYVSRIRQWYPDSPIIRIIRDPRDVALSLLRVAWGAKSLLSALALWKLYDDRSARFFEVDSRCHTLRFEDLVSEPELTLRALCKAIDEPFDPAMLDTSTSARLVNAADEAWKEKVGAGVDVSRAAAWRKSLSEAEIKMCEACLGDRLITYGYPTMDFEFSQSIEVHRLDLLDQFPEIAANLVMQGARLWTLPGERIEASLFVGDPNQWLGNIRQKRFGTSLQLIWTILRRRLGGVPITWLKVPVRTDVQGYSARLLARLLPRPVANYSVLETSSPTLVA